MTAQEMWQAYSALAPDETRGKSYEAWAFGTDPDELAALVLSGKKTATASAWPEYEDEGLSMPEPGGYNIILNTAGEAVCIIRDTQFTRVPFNEMTERQAFKEGEGDRSLAYWKKVHTEAFTRHIGSRFNPEMLVVCQEFEKVYPQ